jgi:selenium metabolism protein YedF
MTDGAVVLLGQAQQVSESDELGRILGRNFIRTMATAERKPSALIFVNAGVFYACTGSEVLEELGQLSAAGVEVLSCGTCVDFFKVREQVAVGSVSNMQVIVDLLLTAHHVIRF